MQYPSDKNFHAFKNALKWNASAKALWQQLLESHESAITLNIFRHLLCLFRVKGWPICVFCIFDGLCARQKLFSTHCIIRYLIPTNLPSCSKHLHYWMTVFCATFYISFNFFNFLNPFANSLILWTVNQHQKQQKQNDAHNSKQNRQNACFFAMSLPNQIQDAILSCDISCLFKLRTLFGLPDYQLRIFVITIVTVHSSYIHVSLIQKVMLSHYHTFRNSIQRFLKGPHFIDQSLFIIYLKYIRTFI